MTETSRPPARAHTKDFILGEREDDDVVVITRSSFEKMMTASFASLLAILIAVLAWVGNGAFERLDSMDDRLDQIERRLENTITLQYLQENFVSLRAFDMLQERVQQMENDGL